MQQWDTVVAIEQTQSAARRRQRDMARFGRLGDTAHFSHANEQGKRNEIGQHRAVAHVSSWDRDSSDRITAAKERSGGGGRNRPGVHGFAGGLIVTIISPLSYFASACATAQLPNWRCTRATLLHRTRVKLGNYDPETLITQI